MTHVSCVVKVIQDTLMTQDTRLPKEVLVETLSTLRVGGVVFRTPVSCHLHTANNNVDFEDNRAYVVQTNDKFKHL